MSASDARYYLQEHRIPQLFEGLMTGLIFNRPQDPLEYLEHAISQVRTTPEMAITWDMLVSGELPSRGRDYPSNDTGQPSHQQNSSQAQVFTNTVEEQQNSVQKDDSEVSREPSRSNTVEHRSPEPQNSTGESQDDMVVQRVPSVTRAAEVARIPDVPIVLFMGGPGGGKTKHAARVANALVDQGLVHICMPDVIRSAIMKYKDKYPEWKEANEHYIRGELIPNQLALTLLKAEMGRHQEAQGFFLEGYPREARQVEDFERQVKSVNMALILDYDERTLREHMERRGLGMEIIDQKIKEFKQKTLPSAKYFDDQKLLHLIPGEKDDTIIYEKMRGLVMKALETGVPVINNNSAPSSSHNSTKSQMENHHNDKSGNMQIPDQPHVTQPTPEPVDSEVRQSAMSTETVNHVNVGNEQSSSTVRPPKGVPPSPPKSNHKEREEASTSTPAVQTPESATRSSVNTRENHRPQTEKFNDGASSSTPQLEPHDQILLSNNAPVVLVLGAPGSQKNDIGRRIAQKYDGFTLLSMGEILRKKINNEKNDPMWEKVEKKMNNGESIPTKLCRTLLFEELQSRGTSNWGYVIEGYPKSPDQLVDLENTLQKIDLAILIDCTEQFCLSVIEKRNEEHKRSDDTVEFVKSRMDFFKRNTLPMLKTLDERGKLRVVRNPHATVDGDSDPDSVFKEIVQVVDHALFIEDDGEGASLNESKKGPLNASTNSSSG